MNSSGKKRFRSPSSITGLALLFAVGVVSSTQAQCERQEDAKLISSNGMGFDSFGRSVALDGDKALIGANASAASFGSVYDFRYDGVQWIQNAQLTASDGAVPDQFGWRVAMEGDVAAIAATGANGAARDSGAVYIFRFNGTDWVESEKVRASDGESGESFGWALSMSGDLLVVGAINDDDLGTFSGSAYVYRWDGSRWNEEQKLLPSDGEAVDQFGFDVDIDGEVIVVGSVNEDQLGSDAGAVYVYRFDGSAWVEEQKIVANDGVADDWFGWSTAVDGDRLVTGAVNQDDPKADGGAVYSYTFDGTMWNLEQKLQPTGLRDLDSFGWDLDLRGSRLWVGSPGANGVKKDTGAAYSFHFDGSQWIQVHKLIGSDGGGGFNDSFGAAVTSDGSNVLCGAFFATGAQLDSGAAFVFPILDLALAAKPASVIPGDMLTLTTCGGKPGALGMLLVVDFSGSPLFFPVDIGAFDSSGERVFGGTVPSGLSGNTIDFLAIGFWQPHKAAVSEPVQVDFQ